MDKYFCRRSLVDGLKTDSPNLVAFGSIFEFLCPDCNKWGKITEDQYYGRESIRHAAGPCKFDKKVDVNLGAIEMLEGDVEGRPAVFWMEEDGLHVTYRDGKKESVVFNGAYVSKFRPGNWDPNAVIEGVKLDYEKENEPQ